MVMIEEKLQPIVDDDCLKLSMILASENKTIRLDSTVMPDGLVYVRSEDAEECQI